MKTTKPKSSGSLFHLWLVSIISISILIPQLLCAQGGVGIGTDNPHTSAILDIQPPGNNKGLLIPRLTTEQINVIPGEEGLLVYDTIAFSLKVYTQGAWSNVGTPRGAIIMWSGVTPPPGWALCDGQAGRPNLLGRFVIGYNPSVVDYSAIGNTGGNSTVTLTLENMPRHTHSLSINSNGAHTHSYNRHTSKQVGSNAGGGEPAADPSGAAGTSTTSSGSHNHTGTIGMTGGTAVPDVNAVPYDNRPPYYVLAYIIKL